MELQKLYDQLLAKYGQQGWWPLLCDEANGERYTCYHPGNYDLPQIADEKLEICIGAILTQNTNWLNVEKALYNLRKNELISVKGLLNTSQEHLAELIKPSGYYNQKARKLKEYCLFYQETGGRKPERSELLSIWGIGRETADSMLLYAYSEPVMVIDTYTRRVFRQAGYSFCDLPYDKLRELCEQQLTRDYRIYQEFHALLVQAGKEMGKKPKIRD